MTVDPHNTQIDDHGQHAEGSGSNVSVRLVGFDRPFVTAFGLALAITFAVAAWVRADDAAQLAQRTDAKSVYWLQRDDAFLEQLAAEGYKVPPDLLHHGGDRP